MCGDGWFSRNFLSDQLQNWFNIHAEPSMAHESVSSSSKLYKISQNLIVAISFENVNLSNYELVPTNTAKSIFCPAWPPMLMFVCNMKPGGTGEMQR